MSVWLPLKNPRSETLPLLNMALSAACAKALNQLGIRAEIKWPNDLRHAGAKLAGLLMEVQSEAATGKALCLGIGVNVNQTDFTSLPQPATSLKNITGKEHNLMDLARTLLIQLQMAFRAWDKCPDDAIFLQDFNQLLEGKNGIWQAESGTGQMLQGQLHGVDAQGRLLLETEGKICAYHHGTVRLKICLSHQ
jgi:BirA family biotin operon repressor/biotin-[acetyl-CoA-carboxylase] ligase